MTIGQDDAMADQENAADGKKVVLRKDSDLSNDDSSFNGDQRMRFDSESTDDGLCIEPLDLDDIRRYNELSSR